MTVDPAARIDVIMEDDKMEEEGGDAVERYSGDSSFPQ
ncbi:hypothetical protein A2U01_0029910 [Trifolium medium]|uniref:Uncharacterized protein n=1 Tax=Trifolium medium TaxID=97028 RepID=A0A392PBH0_9FABA|nr:hypothetical protein [Trifolium medium]